MQQHNINRIIICSGGRLGAWAIDHIKHDDILIGADSGASFLVSQGYVPDISIGDFDSVSSEQLDTIYGKSKQVIACDPIDKNYTDTEMAFRLALDMKPTEIILLGALGTRFDHSLANVHLLTAAADQGIEARIVDQHNLIRLVTDITKLTKNDYMNVSLLPLSDIVEGITLLGFQYPLTDATLKIGQSLGISNVLVEPIGQIQISAGKLLVIQSRD